MTPENTPKPHYPVKIESASELGRSIRLFRKSHHLSLEKVTGVSNVSIRFLSELERGKETAELGKTLDVLKKLGLEVIIQPRGYTGDLNEE